MIWDAFQRCLSAQISVSLRMSEILVLLFIVGTVSSLAVRYRVTTKYKRLSKELDNEEDEDQAMLTEMWREPSESDGDSFVSEKNTTSSSHFDEFLKAIKVFGFLEQEVFTELTKSTQTLRIVKGEQVKLSELGGFAVVIAGSMKVYCQKEPLDDESGYDLLNEIGVASPISSLSSILSLFSNGMVSHLGGSEFDKVNNSTIAVASQPSTIVIIPTQAFRDLTSKYPHAAANIVQIILFRWSQVTFRTCQRYLNLTQQFYGTERALNERARSRVDGNLPKWLVDDMVRQLRERADEASEKVIELRTNRTRPARGILKKPDSKEPIRSSSGSGSGSTHHHLAGASGSTASAAGGTLGSAFGSAFGSGSGHNQFDEFRKQTKGSHNVEVSAESRRSSAFPGDLLSHATLNYHTHVPGSSLNGSFVNLSEQPSQVRNRSNDSEEAALRRAIVEKMFSTIMFDAASLETNHEEPEAPSHNNDSNNNSHNTNQAPPVQVTKSKLADDQDAISPLSSACPTPGLVQKIPALKTNAGNSQSNSNSNSSKSQNYNTSPKPRSNSVGGGGTSSTNNASGRSKKKTARFRTEADDDTPSFEDILEDASEYVELLLYRKGEYISKYGEKCRGLIYVLSGTLEVGHHTNVSYSGHKPKRAGSKYERLYDVEAGNITGFLETISSYTSFVDLIAKEDCCLAIISRAYIEQMAEINPLLYISAAKALTISLTRPMVQLDFALEWISLKSGGKLFREGSTANAIYFVLNGRVRAYSGNKLIGDYGHGSTIGELETMGGEPYSATVVAVRDTELSRFPRTLVECLARQYPSVTFEMSRMVVQAMIQRNSQVHQAESNFSDFKTLAVLPTSSSIPVEDFALKLSSAFQVIGRDVKVLTNSVILGYLGKHAFHKMGALRLRAYLADLEDRYDLLLYVADGLSTSQWSRTCIDQADCVLLLADGESHPVFSDVERMVVRSPTRSRAHLVLLHSTKQVRHGSTAKWLRNRPWISAHHHIQMDFVHEDESSISHTKSGLGENNQKNRVQRKIKEIKDKVQDEFRLLQHRKSLKQHMIGPLSEVGERLQYKNDFNRLARVLAGEAIGLVLGGGGARGISHVGVLQALEEAGIPIDMVGGTSIGSLIGGLYAQDYDIMPLLRKSKQFSARVSSFWRLLLDLTYPMTAWTTGHAFNRAVWKCLGDSRIEDFWVKYFTNTTNLTHSRMEVHQRGYAWRYIRASMSLAGLLPPIEEKGQMLLDGGYVDNLPVFEMKKMGARYIIAVDVGAVDDTTPLKYGDTLSGLWALINKWNPLSTTPNVPNIAEIQQRLTYVSSVKALEEAKVADGVLYLRPPIDNYATLDFAKFDDIREVGFTYGTDYIQKSIAENKLPTAYLRNISQKGSRLRYRRHSI